MRRLVPLSVLLAAGCSTAPLAGFLDTLAPIRATPGANFPAPNPPPGPSPALDRLPPPSNIPRDTPARPADVLPPPELPPPKSPGG